MIEYLENKIKSCDELGGMEKEKWAFTQCLKHYRGNSKQVQVGVKVNFAKTDTEKLDIEARKFLLDNKCDDLVLNDRPFNKGNYLYASDIMVKFKKRFDIYAKAINQIDDYFEYMYKSDSNEAIKINVMKIIDNITEGLSKLSG